MERFVRKILKATAILLILSTKSYAYSLIGRTGIGFSNQLKGDISTLSFKMQKSRDFAYGAIAGIKANDEVTDYGLGAKFYKNIFDEPHLNFYAAGMAALLQVNDQSGFQIDGTLGSEFHLPGIESLGFSFEFGISLNKLNSSTNVETVGYNFFNAAIHFYL
jgi:hypothetical protein